MLLKIFKIISTNGFLTDLECTKIRFRPGLCPGPRWGSLQRSPDRLAGLRTLLLMGRGKREERGKGDGRKKGETQDGTGSPYAHSWIRHFLYNTKEA